MSEFFPEMRVLKNDEKGPKESFPTFSLWVMSSCFAVLEGGGFAGKGERKRGRA
jgi:hypothetical protein